MERTKMIRTAEKLDAFFRVMEKVTVIAAVVMVVVMAVLTAVNAVNPDVVIGEDFHLVDLGPLTVELAEEYAPDNSTVLSYAWIYVALGLAAAAVIRYAFSQIRRVLQPMKEGDPFRPEVSDHIRRLGYVALVLGVVQNLARTVETANAVRHFGLDRLAAGGQIRSVTANYTFDLSFLVVFFVLLLMSYIFRYGAELQQLSDETL